MSEIKIQIQRNQIVEDYYCIFFTSIECDHASFYNTESLYNKNKNHKNMQSIV